MLARAIILTALFLMMWTAPARAGDQAAVQVKVQQGWGSTRRAGRWNPIIVRASSAQPRQVTLQSKLPHLGGYATVEGEQFAVGPSAASFELLAPSHPSPFEQSVTVLSDAQSGRTLAQFPADLTTVSSAPADMGPDGVLIGMSGRPQVPTTAVRYVGARVAFLAARFLPRAPIGYDALEVLYLNQVRADELDLQQQQAILAWVRAGGSLLYVPDLSARSAEAPLVESLPCRVGPIEAFALTESQLRAAGLQDRFGHMAVRSLLSEPGARTFTLFAGTGLQGVVGRAGLGRIVVLPIDLAALQFDEPREREAIPAFWNPILEQLLAAPHPRQERQAFDTPYFGFQSESEDQQREGVAVNALCDYVGRPTWGAWEGWIWPLAPAAVLICLVVGPLDVLILRGLGRRSVTASTVIGCLALALLVALYVARRWGPNPISMRTAEVVEQVDDATVASSDLVGIGSSRGLTCRVEPASRAGWWQPVIPGATPAGGDVARADLHFHQSDTADLPEPMGIEPGDVRYLRADRFEVGPAAVEVHLAIRPGPDGAPRLIGTIKNTSAGPLVDLHVRTARGVVEPQVPGGHLDAQQVLPIDLPAAAKPFSNGAVGGRYQNYGEFGSRAYVGALNPADLWAVVPDLSGRRSLRVDAMIESSEFAAVYARFDQAPSPARLLDVPQAVERHDRWLRAVVPLGR